MKLRNVLLAASVLALPAAAAMAQPVDGLYIGGGAGFNWLQNQSVKSYSAQGIGGEKAKGAGHFKSSGGPVVVGSVGYGFGNGLRAEGELNYRFTHEKLKGGNGIGGGFDNNTYGLMANVLYDFNGLSKYVVPYVGAGAGLEMVSARSTKVYDTTGAGGFNGSSDNAHFGAQAIAGAAIPTGVPGLAVTAEYRFMTVLGKDKMKGTYTDGADSVKGSVSIDNQYNHSFLVGLRYNFGVHKAAAPAPAPMVPVAAPAPAPARTYLVFFDWDKADLTPRAHQIISEAAQNSTKVQVTQIEVDGHADRSGTPAYNMKLSKRRADAVAADLVRLGVPQNVIYVQAFGDTHPLVPTAAGVREPQNRRVEIILK